MLTSLFLDVVLPVAGIVGVVELLTLLPTLVWKEVHRP